jgi:hypothetical protein
MKRMFLVPVTAIFLFLPQLLAQPKIQIVNGTQLDFGDVYHGNKADKVITVKNIGNDTLRITDIHAQCGCTAAMMSDADKRLGPNQVGKLSISFNTQNYSGPVSKQVYISSNDTSNARVTITFKTNVMEVLGFDPKLISFDNMKLDSTYSKTITITNPSAKEPIRILSVESKNPMLKVSLMKNQLMPGEKTQLQATFKPDKTGTFQGTVDFTTDHSTNPKLSLNFYAWVNKK